VEFVHFHLDLLDVDDHLHLELLEHLVERQVIDLAGLEFLLETDDFLLESEVEEEPLSIRLGVFLADKVVKPDEVLDDVTCIFLRLRRCLDLLDSVVRFGLLLAELGCVGERHDQQRHHELTEDGCDDTDASTCVCLWHDVPEPGFEYRETLLVVMVMIISHQESLTFSNLL
jgi:hypothetical protein